jgi:hypothetical protein
MESLVRFRATLMFVSVFLLFSIEVFVCGNSPYRAGNGVSYRVFTVPLPGSSQIAHRRSLMSDTINSRQVS